MAKFFIQEAHDIWILRNINNNRDKLMNKSLHLHNRMRAKVEKIYNLASERTPDIRLKLLPEPLENFLSKHNSNTIIHWYDMTKPAIKSCIRRMEILNDCERLPPNHPENTRIPPDGE